MSVVLLGNGTTTSSIGLGSYNNSVFRDTVPNTRIFSDIPNATRVVGDGGFDFVYRRGKPRAVFSLDWVMLPQGQLLILQRIWAIVENHHWFTVQTSDLSEKSELFNTLVGTSIFIQGSLDGVNPMPGTAINWIFLGKWVIWTAGANVGTRIRITDFFTTGHIQMENSLTLANGNRFFIGYPARFVSPLQVNQYGNISTHYNVSVDCEVMIS